MLNADSVPNSWKTKPTDRFVLRWIKCHLSARITPRLVNLGWLRPWMITISSASCGVVGGVIFALGLGWLGALFAGAGQVLDGVDGQFARLTEKESKSGALLDSVLDRYADGAMVIGLTLYLIRLPIGLTLWQLIVLGSLAVIGSNLQSYSLARAQGLGIGIGTQSLASKLADKGTRTTVMVLSGLLSLIWRPMPVVALFYLALYTNLMVARRMFLASKIFSRSS